MNYTKETRLPFNQILLKPIFSGKVSNDLGSIRSSEPTFNAENFRKNFQTIGNDGRPYIVVRKVG